VIVFALTCLPFIVYLVLRISRPPQIITIYGRLHRARMIFWLRNRKMRGVHDALCRLARDRQARLAREIAQAAKSRSVPAPPTTAG
jgi:hypothetical protein